MASNTKLSFAFGGVKVPGTGAPAAAAPKSNLEALMAKAKPVSKPKPTSLFDDDDDDPGPTPAPPSLAGPSRPRAGAPPSKSSSATNTSTPKDTNLAPLPRASRKAQEEALALDASVFDYDGMYDQLKSRERAAEAAKKAESDDRKPKYMDNFLASAQTRKLDRLRAEEKMLAHEREKEGGQFEDKEKFVTEAYKKQMEEVKRAEEEERQREESIRKSGKGPGLTAFYKNMLDNSSAAHDAALEPTSSSGPSLAIKPPTAPGYEPEAEYDPFLAREAAAAQSSAPPAKKTTIGPDGSVVEINDEGEVIDKRDLLRAGLNITKKPKVELPDSLLRGKSGAGLEGGVYQSKAVGTAAGYQDRMRRERERLAQALKEENERKRADAERRAQEEEEAARRRKEGDDGEAEKRREEARERFRERKRKMEEEAKAKKGDKGGGEIDAKKAKLF